MSLIRSKLEQGVYLSLKEKRDYIKWCINYGLENDKIISEFKKYDMNLDQFNFYINDLRSDLKI